MTPRGKLRRSRFRGQVECDDRWRTRHERQQHDNQRVVMVIHRMGKHPSPGIVLDRPRPTQADSAPSMLSTRRQKFIVTVRKM